MQGSPFTLMTSLMPMGIPPSGSETSAASGSAQGGLKITGKKRLHGRVHRLDARFKRAQDVNGVKGLGAETLLKFGSGEAGEIHHSTTFGTMIEVVGGARRDAESRSRGSMLAPGVSWRVTLKIGYVCAVGSTPETSSFLRCSICSSTRPSWS